VEDYYLILHESVAAERSNTLLQKQVPTRKTSAKRKSSLRRGMMRSNWNETTDISNELGEVGVDDPCDPRAGDSVLYGADGAGGVVSVNLLVVPAELRPLMVLAPGFLFAVLQARLVDKIHQVTESTSTA